MSERTEQSDLARSLEGDGEAYARIVGRYQAPIARRMRLFARQPQAVEELVQEVFVEAYYSLSKYRGQGAFAAWLAQIATRTGYRYWKRRGRSTQTNREGEWWRELAQQDVTRLDPAVASRLVHALLDRLPPRDRLVLLLIYIEGHSVDEAAQLAGWSKTMIKVQAFRARRKLRALLADLGIDNIQAAGELTEDVLHERT